MVVTCPQWINERRARIGAVFVRGPTCVGYQPEGVARLIAYIHRNPVRAGIVARASDSSWTSHAAYIGRVQPPPWLDIGYGLELAGFHDAAELDTWVDAAPTDREYLEAARLEPLRRPGRPKK